MKRLLLISAVLMLPWLAHGQFILNDMFPSFAVNNSANRSLGHAVKCSQFDLLYATFRKPFSYFGHCGIIELGYVLHCSLRCSMARFCNTILNVLRLVSEPQMSRIHTQRIISSWAVVTDVHSRWNWSVGQYPRDTMRYVVLSIVEMPVRRLVTMCACLPQPALVWTTFVNFCPKSLLYWVAAFSLLVATRLTATKVWGLSLVGRIGLELSATNETLNLHLNSFLFDSGATRPAFHCAVAFCKEDTK